MCFMESFCSEQKLVLMTVTWSKAVERDIRWSVSCHRWVKCRVHAAHHTNYPLGTNVTIIVYDCPALPPVHVTLPASWHHPSVLTGAAVTWRCKSREAGTLRLGARCRHHVPSSSRWCKPRPTPDLLVEFVWGHALLTCISIQSKVVWTVDGFSGEVNNEQWTNLYESNRISKCLSTFWCSKILLSLFQAHVY